MAYSGAIQSPGGNLTEALVCPNRYCPSSCDQLQVLSNITAFQGSSPFMDYLGFELFLQRCAGLYFSTLNLILFLKSVFKLSRNLFLFTLFLRLAKQHEQINSTAEWV